MFIKVIFGFFWIAVFICGILMWLGARERKAQDAAREKVIAAENKKIKINELNNKISYCRGVMGLALAKIQSHNSIGHKKFWGDIYSSASAALSACELAINSDDIKLWFEASSRHSEIYDMFRKKVDIKKSEIKVLVLDEYFNNEIERQLRKFGITNITTSDNPKKDLQVMNSRFVHEFDFILFQSATDNLYFDDVKIDPVKEGFDNYALVTFVRSVVGGERSSIPMVLIDDVTVALNRKFNFVD